MCLRLCLLLLWISLTQTIFAQTSGPKDLASSRTTFVERYTSTSRRYSIPVPAGWKNLAGENRGLRDNVFMHPTPVQGFSTNIVFIEEPTSAYKRASLAQLVSIGTSLMEKKLPSFKLLDRKELKSSSGVPMIRVLYEGLFVPNGLTSRNAVYYALLKDGYLLSITVSGVDSTPEEHRNEAEAAILGLERID
jgi:hypothetical protein